MRNMLCDQDHSLLGHTLIGDSGKLVKPNEQSRQGGRIGSFSDDVLHAAVSRHARERRRAYILPWPGLAGADPDRFRSCLRWRFS
jgi:hypothetical protein